MTRRIDAIDGLAARLYWLADIQGFLDGEFDACQHLRAVGFG